MSSELNRLLKDKAERGEWRGAEKVLESATRDLHTAPRLLARDDHHRRSWVPALGVALVALALIVAGVVLFADRETRLGVASQPTVASTTVPASPTTAPVSGTTTLSTSTTLAFVQSPMTWSRVEIDGAGTGVAAVVAGGPGYVAAGYADGNAAFWTSPDGVTWNRITDDEAVFGGDGRYEVNDLVKTGTGFVAIGGNSKRDLVAWTSSDGLAWNRIPIEVDLGDAGKVTISSMTAGTSGLVAVGWTTSVDHPELIEGLFAIRSTDGSAWQRADTTDLLPGGMKDVTAGGPGYVAVGIDASGKGSGGVWTSPDGLAWTLVDQANASAPSVSVVVGLESVATAEDGRLYAFAGGSAWTSADGDNWTWIAFILGDPESGFSQDWSGWPTAPVASGDRIVVAGSLEFRGEAEPDRAAVWASNDAGVTWQRMSLPLDVFGDQGAGGMSGLAERDGTYVAVGTWNSTATVWLGTWNEGL